MQGMVSALVETDPHDRHSRPIRIQTEGLQPLRHLLIRFVDSLERLLPFFKNTRIFIVVLKPSPLAIDASIFIFVTVNDKE